jgi:hypothetical protein
LSANLPAPAEEVLPVAVAGRPANSRPIGWANDPVVVIPKLKVAVSPLFTVSAAGVAVSSKLAVETPTARGVCTDRAPLVPLMMDATVVAVVVVGAVGAAVSFKMTAVPGAALVGVNTPVTPVGKPVTLRATGELNPAVAAMVRFTLAELPGVSVTEFTFGIT